MSVQVPVEAEGVLKQRWMKFILFERETKSNYSFIVFMFFLKCLANKVVRRKGCLGDIPSLFCGQSIYLEYGIY